MNTDKKEARKEFLCGGFYPGASALEMKSLYGSITRSAVISFSYATSLSGDELLPAVDVVCRARKRRVNHDVYG